MKKFMLSSSDIEQYATSYHRWKKMVSHREIEYAFHALQGRKFHTGLELGAGGGEQSLLLSQWCDHLICTEKYPTPDFFERDAPHTEYREMDAQDLSGLADHSIDLIYSGNVMEHIPDVDRCLQECSRILRDGGLMVHIMPNRWWKFFYYGVSILRFQRPVIHGISKTHWREFVVFGVDSWKKTFTRNDLGVTDVVGLPFYFGHGPSYLPLIKAGNRLGIPASYCYYVERRST